MTAPPHSRKLGITRQSTSASSLAQADCETQPVKRIGRSGAFGRTLREQRRGVLLQGLTLLAVADDDQAHRRRRRRDGEGVEQQVDGLQLDQPADEAESDGAAALG